MKKALIRIILLILFLSLIFLSARYFWNNRHRYFFKGEQPFELKKEQTEGLQGKKEDQKQEEADQEIKDPQKEINTRPKKEYQTPEIKPEDCKNRCRDYKDDKLNYCQEICGFAEPIKLEEAEAEDNNIDINKQDQCEVRQGFEKDSCYKWKAVKEKNLGFCDKISDKALAESCHNRVIEEILP